MKLYEFSYSRSLRCHWMLRELGIDFETQEINLPKGEGQSPEYLAINPNGKVPTLEDEGFILWESLAILNYLAEKDPEKRFIPQEGTRDRALYYQWTTWCVTELEQPLWTMAKNSFIYPEDKRSRKAKEMAVVEFKKAAAIIEKELWEKEALINNTFSAADILLTHTGIWGDSLNLLEEFPPFQEYCRRMRKREAFPHDYYPSQ